MPIDWFVSHNFRIGKVKAMRLYNASSCTPTVMKGIPSRWRSQHHFLPLLDTVPVKSAKTDRDGVFRSAKAKQKADGSTRPTVIKSSTNTTASTSPERKVGTSSDGEYEGDDAISFSDLPQRSSFEIFHFDLDTYPDDAEPVAQKVHCDGRSSCSTVSSKNIPLLGTNYDALSFEDFTGDDFEDAQQSGESSDTSPFKIYKPRVQADTEVERLFSSASVGQSQHTFPPIEKPIRPPQVPLMVANPVAVCEPAKDRRASKVAPVRSVSRMSSGIVNIVSRSSNTHDQVEEDDIELFEGSPMKEKYLRMLKVGLPMGAVKLEMAKDGVAPPKKSSGGPKNHGGDTQRLRIHWEKFHPLSKTSAPSLWRDIKNDDIWLSELQVDRVEMKSLFERNQSAKTIGEIQPKNQSMLRVIEPKRANNCAIFLASLDLSFMEISAAIEAFDHEAFSLEQIHDLMRFLPTEKEAAVLKANLKANSQVKRPEGEQFMIEMIKIEDPETKLDIMSAMKQFPGACQAVTKQASLLKTVCEEIILSSGLRKTIGLALYLGNLVNELAGKGSVEAVRISCLLKLSQTRSFDTKTSFLDYVASVAVRNGAPIDFPASIDDAVKVDWKNAVAGFEKLDEKLPQIRKFILKDMASSVQEDQELNLLESTLTGRFALDGYRKAALVYAEIQEVQASFKLLCDYFGESPEDPQALIREVATFCHQFQLSVAKMEKKAGASCPLPTILESRSSFASV